MMDFDTKVKLAVYGITAETGRVPDAVGTAQETESQISQVQAAFERLARKRLLVLEPGDPSRIRMAPPFSGIPTSFRVEAGGRNYFANCVWDALGVPAALHTDAVVQAEDAHTQAPMTLEIRQAAPVPCACVAHFAVPAARWWDDIIFT